LGAVVTLEGTIIHKSGLITGGRSTHNSGKKWEEKDVQGTFFLKHSLGMDLILTSTWFLSIGLSRTRDNIKNQLSELVKQKPRNKEDDNLISEMARLEAVLQVSRDDLVRHTVVEDRICCLFSHLWSLQSACNHKLQGIKDELKHIDKSLKQDAPEHDKVLFLSAHLHQPRDLLIPDDDSHEKPSISYANRSNTSRPLWTRPRTKFSAVSVAR